jgi:cytochrome c-type biogenesis protein CcmH
MRLRALLAALAALACLAAAADPAERLADPAREARARALFSQVRCVVCQNESIDDSEADLAHDLRQTIRGEIAKGETDAQVRGFLVQRYGEFILLTPRFSIGNAGLWLTPFLIAVLGGGLLAWRGRRAAAQTPDLTAEEEARLAGLPDA